MFSRIRRSWELVKASWAVLRADKELIVFPIVSAVVSIFVFLTFLVPTILAGVFDQIATQDNVPFAGYVVAFLFYTVSYGVTIYFNSALVGAAMIRLRGGDPNVGDGFRAANSHLGAIIQYALISATVGMVLRLLRERGGLVGGIVSMIGGLAWSLATFLVIPVLIIEEVSPFEAIRRSAGLLKKTWGEQIAGNLSIGLVFGLFTLLVIVAGIPLVILALATESIILTIAAISIVVLLVIGVQMIGSALNGIYVAAVYRYAVDGDTTAYFRDELIEGAFKQK